jgi:uncharacterized membrane protein
MDKIAQSSKNYSKLLKKADINDNDVMIIWDTLSLYIRDELSKKRGEFIIIIVIIIFIIMIIIFIYLKVLSYLDLAHLLLLK